MSSSSDRTKLFSSKIPDLNGTNCRAWADAVKAFARYNGVWFLIEGYGTTATTQVVGMARPTPVVPDPNATPPVQGNAAEVAAWDQANDKLLGIIQMYIAANLQHHVKDLYTALEAWNALKGVYSTPGAVGAFVEFQKLFNTQLKDTAPLGPQIDAMIEAAAHVT